MKGFNSVGTNLKLIILFGIFLTLLPILQTVNALNNQVHFHFQKIGILGNSVIVKVTGSKGQVQQWRILLVPLIGNEVVRILDSNGFHNGEKVTACVQDVGNGKPTTQDCDSTTVSFNSGTDFYLTIPSTSSAKKTDSTIPSTSSAKKTDSTIPSTSSAYTSGFKHGVSDGKKDCSKKCNWYILQPGKGFRFHTSDFNHGYINGFCSVSPSRGSDADEATWSCP